MDLLRAPAGVDPVVKPSSYEELYRNYFGYVVAFVQKQGIEQQSAQDVASAIMMRFLERDFLAEFNPDLEFVRGGVVKKARFQSFLNAFVIQYVKHYRERQSTHRTREPVIADQPLGEDGKSWIQLFGPSYTEEYGDFEESESVAHIRAYLSKVKRRSSKDIADMPRLFDAVVAQSRLYGRINRPELEQIFGVSSSAIGTWLSLLRTHVRAALES